MSQTTIVIHWRGPYRTLAELDGGNGLYLLTGRCKGDHQEWIQYCGITEGLYYNRLYRHHKIEYINDGDLGIWLGQVIYPQDPSRYYLAMAEKILVYFWQPQLNERLRYYPPEPTNLISQWFHRDGRPRFRQLEIYRDLSDVICWDGEYWRTGNLKVYENF